MGICFEQVKGRLLPNQDLRLRIVAVEAEVIAVVAEAEVDIVAEVVVVAAAENHLAPFVAGSCQYKSFLRSGSHQTS